MANRIKELRQQRKITLQQLSKQTGISVSSLSAYENDRRSPKIENWKKIADFFDVSVPYLQGISNKKGHFLKSDFSMSNIVMQLQEILIYLFHHQATGNVPDRLLKGLSLSRYEMLSLLSTMENVVRIHNENSFDKGDQAIKQYSGEILQALDNEQRLSTIATPQDILKLINTFYVISLRNVVDKNIDNESVISGAFEGITTGAYIFQERTESKVSLQNSDSFESSHSFPLFENGRLPKNVNKRLYTDLNKVFIRAKHEVEKIAEKEQKGFYSISK